MTLLGYTDKCEWPFRKDAMHQRVYAPLGVFGRQYQIESLEQYNRLKAGTGGGVGLTILFTNFAGLFRHVWGGSLQMAVGLLCAAGYLCWHFRSAHKMTVVKDRPPLLKALRLATMETQLWRLWVANLGCIALGTFLLSGKRQGCGDGLTIEQWICISLLGLCAVAVSYMICCRTASPPSRERVPMRR